MDYPTLLSTILVSQLFQSPGVSGWCFFPNSAPRDRSPRAFHQVQHLHMLLLEDLWVWKVAGGRSLAKGIEVQVDDIWHTSCPTTIINWLFRTTMVQLRTLPYNPTLFPLLSVVERKAGVHRGVSFSLLSELDFNGSLSGASPIPPNKNPNPGNLQVIHVLPAKPIPSLHGM